MSWTLGTLTNVPISRTCLADYARLIRPNALRAAWWAITAWLRVRRQLAGGVARPTVAHPPRLPRRSGAAVDVVLRRLGASCLEGALVRQRWLASHGEIRDVVIGLPGQNFGPTPAHAWVEGMDPEAAERLVELYRLPVAALSR
jgi:hypothetical protein